VARRVVALLALALAPLAAYGSEATAAVERFVTRLAAAQVTDVAVEQSFTLYQADGRSPSSRGEQRIWLKTPRRQRMEQVIEGQSEARLMVDDRVWQRTSDGRVAEVARTDADRQGLYLIMPLGRTAADLLGEWRALGVRDDVAGVARVGGRDVTIIGARPGERDTPAIWLDPEYGVVRFISRQKLPAGEGTVDLALSEHRPVGRGLYFPYRQEAFVNGRLLVLVSVRAVTVNGGIADELFDPDALRRGR
jgi:outer membrane lipoprotein-sorting protein